MWWRSAIRRRLAAVAASRYFVTIHVIRTGMKKSQNFMISAALPALAALALAAMAGEAQAAQCGNSSGGFDGWKREFSGEARAKGVGASGLAALAGTSYATR